MCGHADVRYSAMAEFPSLLRFAHGRLTLTDSRDLASAMVMPASRGIT
jgi:hypothetical protein